MKKKKLQELATIKFCTISSSRAKEQDATTKWLACTNFMPDNTMHLSPTENHLIPPEDLEIHPGDIIVKRITPTFINYIETIPNGFYAGNNLIILTAKEGVSPKYLAMILNDEITEIAVLASIGAVMKSIARADLEELEIPVPDYEKQQIIGELWYQTIELKKMKMKLSNLETLRNTYLIKKYIHSTGGKYNG